ncbi:MAG: T9SS type A sorting domain-containing protein [Flavobacteriales bacterium]|nr:T9SS type A sorting domain-containing protein [Flavobacteriales bacterium]
MRKQLLPLFFVLSLPAALNAQQIATGAYWSMAICEDQELQVWGSNIYGQFGDGTNNSTNTAIIIPGLGPVLDMQGGYGHTVALAADSTVWCWGRNDFGGLGYGTTQGSFIPQQVANLNGVVAVAAGDMSSAALKADGTLWTWGWNNYGQSGTGITANYLAEPTMVDMTGITSMALGAGYMLVLRNDGSVWGWGLNDRSQLGAGINASTTYPDSVQAVGLTQVVAITASRYYFSAALRADGSVWTWGDNMWGQMGNGTTDRNHVPAQVPGLSDIVAIADQIGQGHICAVRNDGTVWTWGYNLKGQLGNGTNTDSNVPVQVSGLDDVVAVSCGMEHTLALKADGTAWAWGRNASGELGDGTIINSNVPVPVSGICTATGVAEASGLARPLTVTPNPSDGHFRLSTLPWPALRGAIHNALGAKVMDLNTAQMSGAETIALGDRPAGVYLLRVESGLGTATTRIVVQ